MMQTFNIHSASHNSSNGDKDNSLGMWPMIIVTMVKYWENSPLECG